VAYLEKKKGSDFDTFTEVAEALKNGEGVGLALQVHARCNSYSTAPTSQGGRKTCQARSHMRRLVSMPWVCSGG